MKAAIMHGFNRELTIEEIDLGGPRAGEVLVNLKASGVCHSDWHALKGDWGDFPLPLVLGHEGAGVVEEVGANVTAVKPGDHVILAWRTNCGICEMCQHGWPNNCLAPPSTGQRGTVGGERLHRFTDTGTFSTHTIVPAGAPVVMPKEIPFRAGGADRLRGDDRVRRRGKHRAGAGRQHGGGVRLRRRGAELHPRVPAWQAPK